MSVPIWWRRTMSRTIPRQRRSQGRFRGRNSRLRRQRPRRSRRQQSHLWRHRSLRITASFPWMWTRFHTSCRDLSWSRSVRTDRATMPTRTVHSWSSMDRRRTGNRDGISLTRKIISIRDMSTRQTALRRRMTDSVRWGWSLWSSSWSSLWSLCRW